MFISVVFGFFTNLTIVFANNGHNFSLDAKHLEKGKNMLYYQRVTFNDYLYNRRENKIMNQKKVIKKTATGVTAILNTILKIEANSTSCLIAFQPKAPENLSKFRVSK